MIKYLTDFGFYAGEVRVRIRVKYGYGTDFGFFTRQASPYIALPLQILN